ncbi:helix-turn-helix domain-containing protein [Nocardia sp. XZ_19_385]|uniref:helix-turn-helix domain-containing protein n=1 Tax=Nocardia sp. XZ_19_385 TaxID=2769488 RepID=UPI00188DCAE0|nr:helix-turn-helix domain-containing protein [Nocardia sp. XZ_19_385]
MAKMGRRKRSRLITAGLLAPDKVHTKTVSAPPAGASTKKQQAATEPAATGAKVAQPATKAAQPAGKGAQPAGKAAQPAAKAPEPVTGAPERLDVEALAEQVKTRRREKGWTQADVARNGGPSAGTISQIERCLSEEPAADTLAKLDAALEWPENTCEAILRGEMAGARS